MILIYVNDPLDNEDARGHFYHVCRGHVEETELRVPPPDKPYECPHCGIELEIEDFWLAQHKGQA
jgi:hypothetical protein